MQIINNIKKYIINNIQITRKYPIFSILLFSTTIIINIIQYIHNDDYIQNEIKSGNNLFNVFLYLFDLISINGFNYYTIYYLFYFILSYFILSLIEMNIGYVRLFYFIFVILLFSNFIFNYLSIICTGSLSTQSIFNSPFCCGSFVLCSSFGFILYIIQKNMKKKYIKIISVIFIIMVWIGIVIYDRYISYTDVINNTVKTCKMFNFHALFFLFGLLNGRILGQFNPQSDQLSDDIPLLQFNESSNQLSDDLPLLQFNESSNQLPDSHSPLEESKL